MDTMKATCHKCNPLTPEAFEGSRELFVEPMECRQSIDGRRDLSNFATRLEGRDQVTKMYREMYLVGFLLRKPLD